MYTVKVIYVSLGHKSILLPWATVVGSHIGPWLVNVKKVTALQQVLEKFNLHPHHINALANTNAEPRRQSTGRTVAREYT